MDAFLIILVSLKTGGNAVWFTRFKGSRTEPVHQPFPCRKRVINGLKCMLTYDQQNTAIMTSLYLRFSRMCYSMFP